MRSHCLSGQWLFAFLSLEISPTASFEDCCGLNAQRETARAVYPRAKRLSVSLTMLCWLGANERKWPCATPWAFDMPPSGRSLDGHRSSLKTRCVMMKKGVLEMKVRPTVQFRPKKWVTNSGYKRICSFMHFHALLCMVTP